MEAEEAPYGIQLVKNMFMDNANVGHICRKRGSILNKTFLWRYSTTKVTYHVVIKTMRPALKIALQIILKYERKTVAASAGSGYIPAPFAPLLLAFDSIAPVVENLTCSFRSSLKAIGTLQIMVGLETLWVLLLYKFLIAI